MSQSEATKEAKPKQKKLEGFIAVEDEEIADAVEKYVQVRDERMELTKKEVAANQVLVQVLKKHKRKAVSINGQLVELVNLEKAKVKSASSKKEDGE